MGGEAFPLGQQLEWVGGRACPLPRVMARDTLWGGDSGGTTLPALPQDEMSVWRSQTSVAMATAWTQLIASCACVTVASGPQQTRPCAWVRAPSAPSS